MDWIWLEKLLNSQSTAVVSPRAIHDPAGYVYNASPSAFGHGMQVGLVWKLWVWIQLWTIYTKLSGISLQNPV